jgi:osmotically inducible lipoprotein OsmB
MGIKTCSILAVVLVLLTTGCAGMTDQQQRALSGGAIGAGGGAVLGAITGGSPVIGAAVGGAAGVVGGLLVHEHEKGKAEANSVGSSRRQRNARQPQDTPQRSNPQPQETPPPITPGP